MHCSKKHEQKLRLIREANYQLNVCPYVISNISAFLKNFQTMLNYTMLKIHITQFELTCSFMIKYIYMYHISCVKAGLLPLTVIILRKRLKNVSLLPQQTYSLAFPSFIYGCAAKIAIQSRNNKIIHIALMCQQTCRCGCG